MDRDWLVVISFSHRIVGSINIADEESGCTAMMSTLLLDPVSGVSKHITMGTGSEDMKKLILINLF